MPSSLNGTGITFNSGSQLNETPIGYSQGWNSPSRVLGTTYTNSSSRAIQVMIKHNPYSGGTQVDVNGTRVISGPSIINCVTVVSFVVPAGQTYAFNANYGGQPTAWKELR